MSGKNAKNKSMKTIVKILFSATLFSLSTASAKGPAGGNAYTGMFKQRADRSIADFNRGKTGNDRRESPWGGDVGMINFAYICYVVGQVTEDADYTDTAVKMYDAYLDMVDNKRIVADFHAYRPFALMTCRLHEAGLLDGSRLSGARGLSQSFLSWFWSRYKSGRQFGEEAWEHNINMATYVTASALSKTFPDMEEAPGSRGLCKEVADRILRKGDLNENASNYAPLGAVYFFDLLHLEDRMDEIRTSSRFRDYFIRWRDFMSPGVMMPEIGDSYFYHNQLPLDLVLIMEVAARQFNDGSFADEARRIMSSYNTTATISDDQFFRAATLVELGDFTPAGTSEKERSFVSKRTLDGEGQPLAFDKLILKTGNEPGNAMIAMDLYCQGSHSHEFRKSAIAYYEAAGVPLYHNLGRRGTMSANFGNIFWMDDPIAYPGHPEQRVWNTMTIPVNRLKKKEGKYVFGNRKLDFRVFPQKDLKYIVFDNMRLEGPKGMLLIDGFESDALWDRNLLEHAPQIRVETIDDKTEGRGAQKVQWNLFSNEVISRLLPDEFVNKEIDPEEYDVIKIDYKYEGPLPYFHFRGWCDRQLDMGNAVLECSVRDAVTHQMGNDAYGRVIYNDYIVKGAKLVRQMVLTEEGVVVISDSFYPTEQCIGKTAGQLWQLYTLKERGNDYFVAFDDGLFPQADGRKREKRCMMVKYIADKHTECDYKKFVPGYMHSYRVEEGGRRTNYRSFCTTYSRQTIKTLKPVHMVQVIYPLTESESRHAKRIAAATSAVQSKDGSTVVNLSQLSDQSQLTVKFSRDEYATITRSK